MNQTRAGIYFIILVFALFGLLVSQKTINKSYQTIDSSTKTNEPGTTLGTGSSGKYSFTIMKENTQTPISGATVIINTRSPYSSCGTSWKFSETSTGHYEITCTLKSGQSNPTKASVSISRTDYQSKTTDLYYGAFGVFIFLTKETKDTQAPSTPSTLSISSVGSTTATLSWTKSTDNKGVSGYKIYRNNTLLYTNSSTSFTDSSLQPKTSYSYFVKAYDAAGNVSSASNTVTVTTTLTIKDVSLPKVFGGSSTNLSKISNPKKVKKFTIEVKGKNKIVWNEILNLSSQDTANKFKSLNKYLKASKLAIVELDSKSLKVLNKKATVTMYNLPFISTPKILVDGKEDPKTISNINYKKGKLSFNSAHFSKLEAVPTLEVTQPQDGFSTQEPQLSLKGAISDPEAKVTASLNSKDLGSLKVATKSGEFNKEITLTEGKNIIEVIANSSFGKAIAATISGTLAKKEEATSRLPLIGGIIGLVLVIGLAGGGYYFYKKKKSKSTGQPINPNQPTSKVPK